MRALQVEFPCNGVCVDFHHEGVFIGLNRTSTEWVDRPSPAFSTALAFLFSCRHMCMNPQAKPPQTMVSRALGPFVLGFSPLGPRVKYTLVLTMILTFGQLHFVIP
jgi:hypothetical protein